MILCLSGQTCPSATQKPDLSGTYKGTVTSTVDMTSPSLSQPIHSSSTTEFEIVLQSDGRPESLLLNSQDAANGLSSALFKKGETETYTQTFQNGSGETQYTITSTTTVTVREAATTDNGFHVIYDLVIDTTYSGSVVNGMSSHAEGWVEYTGSVQDNLLTYTMTYVQDATTTLSGTTSQASHVELNITGELTRE